MIRLHLEDNTPRLFNPQLIQEAGVGRRLATSPDNTPLRDENGALVYETYNFLLMTGGCDPLAIQEDAETVACLKAAWEERYAGRHIALAVVYVDESGDASFVVAGA